MNEKVLCIPVNSLPERWLKKRVSYRPEKEKINLPESVLQWKNRSHAEQDNRLKQLIPYVIVKSSDDGKIAQYYRKGNETRLHGMASVGVGGHVNPEDRIPGELLIETLKRGAMRELHEEFINFRPNSELTYIGLINEEETHVGNTHIGVVFKIEVLGKPKGSEELKGLKWISISEAVHMKNLELWSRLALILYVNLFDFFTELDLTTDQNLVLKQFNDFLKSDNQIFILKGYAGTGKTTLLKGISEYLEYSLRMGGLMAPTGRAAKVLQNITGQEASTIHRSIYDLENLKTYKDRDKERNDTFKFFFTLKKESGQTGQVYVFDEASMISNRYSDNEFFRFGSGYLLEDILTYFNVNTRKNLKLLFVGDPAQLPPVGSPDSPALDEEFFKILQYKVKGYEMTEVVRQNKDSGIMHNATYYRKLIFSDKVSANYLNTNFNDIEEITYDMLGYIFLKKAPVPNTEKNIVITYSNEKAQKYNRIIRELYFDGNLEIQTGDILQVIKNNYKAGLLNGEFITVISRAEQTLTQSASIFVNKKRENFSFVFRNISYYDTKGNLKDALILETLLDSKNRDLTSEQMKALYVNFIMRYKEKYGAVNHKSETFKMAFRDDPYFNALQVKYGYAITGHKAQGGEWENTFVDFSLRDGLYKDALRWTYTAITRASKKLYVLNAPKKSRFEIKSSHIPIGKVKSVPKSPETHTDIPDATPFHDSNSNPAKRLKYIQIKENIQQLGFEIVNIESREYQEIYTFKKGLTQYKITMSHNKNGDFTYYNINRKNQDGLYLLELVKKETVRSKPFEYQTSEQFLIDLYKWVKKALVNTGLEIVYIDESRKANYQILYVFSGISESYIQFFFNKDERVRSIIAKSKNGEDDEELRNLIINLTQYYVV